MNITQRLRNAYYNELLDCQPLLDGADEIDRLRSQLNRAKSENGRLRTQIRTYEDYIDRLETKLYAKRGTI